MHSDYHSTLIRQLRDQQVRFAPREKKIEQLERCEKLLREIDSDKTYSYEYLCYRITGYRPEHAPIVPMDGDQVRHDLHCLIEDLSESANIRAEELGQPVHTVDQLSKMFNVSTKTISRWRQQGLVSRKIIFDGGRKRVGFLHSSVDHFVNSAKNPVKMSVCLAKMTKQQCRAKLNMTANCTERCQRRSSMNRNVNATTAKAAGKIIKLVHIQKPSSSDTMVAARTADVMHKAMKIGQNC